MTSFTAGRDGISVAYDHLGSGAPVLLLHGFASSREQNWRSTGWYRILDEAGFRLIAPDFRGHGESGKPRDPALYGARMLEDAMEAMEACEAPTCDVIGYSMGGYLAIDLMLRYPERVRKLVVAGVGANYFAAPAWQAIADALESDAYPENADPLVQRFWLFANQKGKDPLALSACIRAGFPRHGSAELKAGRRAVLVVAGSADDHAGDPKVLADAFADGHAVVLAGKDHMNAVGDGGLKRAALAFLGADAALWSPPD